MDLYWKISRLWKIYRHRINAKLREVLRLDVKVSLVQPKTLERFEGKAKRIVDLRDQVE